MGICRYSNRPIPLPRFWANCNKIFFHVLSF
nr:MAG TPA: hypothetical protein [Caudoviricetes sp.]